MNIIIIISVIITIIFLLKTIIAFKEMVKFKSYLNNSLNNSNFIPEGPIEILLLIPVLREQSIIEQTLQKFSEFKSKNCSIHIVIAGTIREAIHKKEVQKNLEKYFNLIKGEKSKKKIKKKLSGLFTGTSIDNILLERDTITEKRFISIFESQKTTKMIVDEWKDAHSNKESACGPYFYYFTSNDDRGDRASQLNSAVTWFRKNIDVKPDIIGVYDADSSPGVNSILEACKIIIGEKIPVCHQPVHFIDFANNLSKQKGNPIMVANALYQTVWTVIRELPRSKHYLKFLNKFNRTYYRNVYLIGHGQFLDLETYNTFGFPENVITDGIQLGYRLSMSNVKIKLMNTFCRDEAPVTALELIKQHSRWFGGCMKLFLSYRWSNKRFKTKPLFQLIDGLYSQFLWAYAPFMILVGLFCIHNLDSGSIKLILQFTYVICLVFYIFVIPYISCRLIPVKVEVRFVDWVCLPVAMILKSIGPQFFFIKFIIGLIRRKDLKFGKVER